MKTLRITAMMLFTACAIAQDKPTPPKLTPGAKLELVEAQSAVLKLRLEQKGVEDYYRQLQQRLDAANAALAQKAKVALKASGIDGEKWDMNLDTLEITVKPVDTKKP